VIFDFLVIGGGIAGASAAYELAAHGSVVLLETETSTSYHTTGRSAALFTRNYGGPAVRKINAASETFFRSPPVGFCDLPLLSPRGALTVAPPGQEATLDDLIALSEPGEEVVDISSQAALEMVPFLRRERIARAVYEENVTDIDVATLHLSYIKGAKARGAEIHTKHPVTSLKRQAGCWLVSTPKVDFQAATIINAAGAWADQVGTLAGARSIGLVPKRRSAIIVDAPTDIAVANLPCIDFVGAGAYIKPEAGHLMVSPGDATPDVPHDVRPDDMDIAVLVDWLETETRVEVSRVQTSWAGLRSFVVDDAPVLGFDPEVPGFFWLAGQGGFGIMMSPTLAIETASLCTTGKLSAEIAASGLQETDLAPSRLYLPE
jgi:D-arginine dehydrogenase